MIIKIAIFLLLFSALLAFCNMSIFTVLRKSRLFDRRKSVALRNIGRYPNNADMTRESANIGGNAAVSGGAAVSRNAGVGRNAAVSMNAAVGRNAAVRRDARGGAYAKPGIRAGAKSRIWTPLAHYRIRLASVLKYSAFDAGIDGLLRLKILMGVLGFILGIIIKNPYLSLVLLAGCFWLPDAYYQITSLHYLKEADEAVETSMAIVTNSYLQNEDIKSSIIENITRIDPPLREVFREFLAETGFVDASVKNALYRMKLKTGNVYFSDWCDILIQCQDDRELKYVLPSIVAKHNSVKKLQIELDTLMYDIYKEFLYVAAIVVLNLPLMFLINSEWAAVLFGTTVGKLTVAATFCIVFLSSAYVVSVNRSLVRMEM